MYSDHLSLIVFHKKMLQSISSGSQSRTWRGSNDFTAKCDVLALIGIGLPTLENRQCSEKEITVITDRMTQPLTDPRHNLYEFSHIYIIYA